MTRISSLLTAALAMAASSGTYSRDGAPKVRVHRATADSELGRSLATFVGPKHHAPPSVQGTRECERRRRQLERQAAKIAKRQA